MICFTSASFLEGQNHVKTWLAKNFMNTKLLADEVASSRNDDRIRDIAKGMLQVLEENPKCEKRLAHLIMVDFKKHETPGIVNKTASYYVFGDLMIAFKAQEQKHPSSDFRRMIAFLLEVRQETANRLLADCSTKEALESGLSRYGADLTHLNLDKFTFLTKDDFALVTRLAPNLRHLKLNRNNQIDDTSISLLAERCTQLQHLDISGCKRVTDISINLLLRKCPNLQYLDLYDCDINGTFIFTQTKICLKLRHLDLAHCNRITRNAICTIAEQCPNLQYLNLDCCDGVNNDAICYLLQTCRHLHTLKLRNSPRITDVTLRFIAENVHSLKILIIYNTNITSEGLNRLLKYTPNLESSYLSDLISPALTFEIAYTRAWHAELNKEIESFMRIKK